MTVPRVLHLINGEHYGGASRVLDNYLQSPARHAQVMVAVFFEGELERRLNRLGIPVRRIQMRGRLDVRAVGDVRRLADEFGAEIIHTHQVRNTLVGRLAARLDRRYLVTHVHSPASRESTSRALNIASGSLDRLGGRLTHRFITVSRSLAEELISRGVSPSRVRVVHNGIPIPPTPTPKARAAARTALGVADDRVAIGMVALFRPRKGTEVLLRAFAELDHRREPPVVLVLIGQVFRETETGYGERLRRLASQLGIADRTVFAGFREDVTELLAGLDMLVLPSLFGEGLPMALLEGMGVGTPVVSTPVEGTAELLQDGHNGLVVPAGDSVALASAIERLLDDPGLRERIGAAARETVAAGYSAESMATGVEGVYAELVSA